MYHFKVKAPMGSQAFAHAQMPILHTILCVVYTPMVQQQEQHRWMEYNKYIHNELFVHIYVVYIYEDTHTSPSDDERRTVHIH